MNDPTDPSVSANVTVSGLQEAVHDAKHTATGFAGVLDRLAEKVGGKADVRAVFGQHVTAGNVTVIPVASVFGGFGAGVNLTGVLAQPPQPAHAAGVAASIDPELPAGLGGGGGFVAWPIGFIEIEGGHARFRRLDDGGASFGIGAGVPGLVAGLALQGVRLGMALWRKRREAKPVETDPAAP